MTLSFILKLIGAILALFLGVYLGMGRFEQSNEELDKALGEDSGPRRVRRHFMFLDLGRKTLTRGSDVRRTRRHFQTVHPDKDRPTKPSGKQ